MGIVITDDKHYSNIAEKMRDKAGTDATYRPEEMPSGIDDVYAAGQSSMVDESKLIPKTVSGSYISVDDVSEIPHSVGCKVESVNKCPEEVYSGYYYDAAPSISGAYERFVRIHPFAVEPSTTYTFRSNLKIYTVWLCNEDGGISRVGLASNTLQYSFTTPDNCTELRISLYNTSGAADTTAFEYAMLNEGTTALPYTPYVKPEEVKVTRCGRNLVTFDKKWNATSRGVSITVNDDGSITANGTATSLMQVMSENIPWTADKDTDVTISFTDKSQSGVQASVMPRDANNVSLGSSYLGSVKTITIPSSCRRISVSLYVTEGTTVENFIFRPMLNIGTTALPYEPYNGQTLTPSADGTVEGMTSVSPYMNIFSDTEGVNIEATYNKSWGMQTEWDRFWDAYQNYGNRTNYYVAFYSGERGIWNNENFKPKYPIKPTNANNMLSNTGIVGDLTQLADIDFSEATNVPSALAYNPWITRIGVCDLRKTQENGTSLFAYSERLVTVDKVIFKDDGTQYAGASGFVATQCYNLKNIVFEGKANFNMNFQHCPLSKASITSVINTLYEGSTGLTATFKLSAVNTAFETSAGARDGSTSAEFAALVATKTNWTITMI